MNEKAVNGQTARDNLSQLTCRNESLRYMMTASGLLWKIVWPQCAVFYLLWLSAWLVSIFLQSHLTLVFGRKVWPCTRQTRSRLQVPTPHPPCWNCTLPVTWSDSGDKYREERVVDGICKVEQRSNTCQKLRTQHQDTQPNLGNNTELKLPFGFLRNHCHKYTVWIYREKISLFTSDWQSWFFFFFL